MSDSRLVVRGGAVLAPDGLSFLAAHTVICSGEMITGVLPDSEVELDASDVVLDVVGGFVLPGLIDAHFHLVSRSAVVADEDVVAVGVVEGMINAAERLVAGVTTVRDAGCRHRGIFALRRAIDGGLVPGPRVFAAGRNPTGTCAPAHWRNIVVAGESEMRAAVSAQLDAGADWVKCVLSHAEDPTEWGAVTQYVSEPELRAAVAVAHDRGARIGVHCEGAEIAAMAVRCGVDALDHAPLIDEPTAQEMAERGTSYIPTLWAFSDDAGIDLDALDAARRRRLIGWRDEHLESVARAREAGVLVAAGSDAVGSLPVRDVLVEELFALRRAGLDNVAALCAATSAGAAVVGGALRLGVMEAGAAADLLVTTADPHRDLETLRTPRFVVSRGALVADEATRLAPLSGESRETFASSVDRWVADDAATPTRSG